MIQRVQTLYLLCAITFVAGCTFFSMAEFIDSAGHATSLTLLGSTLNKVSGISNFISFLTGLVIGTGITSIFLYKKRKWQMKICLMNIALLIMIEVLTLVLLWNLKNEAGGMIAIKLPVTFPVISALLMYLAFRGTKKDDELVRSYDRLR
jgi:Domain of unknown function (DUF4293)